MRVGSSRRLNDPGSRRRIGGEPGRRRPRHDCRHDQYRAGSPTFLFSFSGHSITQFPAVAVIPSEDGSGSEDRQAFAEIEARFFFSFTWDAGSDEFEVSDGVLLSDVAIYTDIDGVDDMDDLLDALIDWDRDEEEPKKPSSS